MPFSHLISVNACYSASGTLAFYETGAAGAGIRGVTNLLKKYMQLISHYASSDCYVFAIQGGSLFATINPRSSGDFSIDFDLEDVSDADDQAWASCSALRPSQSQTTSAMIARRLRRKAARRTVLDAQRRDANSDEVAN